MTFALGIIFTRIEVTNGKASIMSTITRREFGMLTGAGIASLATPPLFGAKLSISDGEGRVHQRIEQHRKGNLDIRVLHPSGQPVSDAKVSVQMVRHAFGFGSAVSRHVLFTRLLLHANLPNASPYDRKRPACKSTKLNPSQTRQGF